MDDNFTSHHSVTAREILNVLFKRKGIIVVLTLGTVCTAVLYNAIIYTPIYTASARVLLDVGPEHIQNLGFAAGGSVRPTIRFNAETQTAIARELLSSWQNIQQVVSSIGPKVIYPDINERALGTVGWIKRQLGMDQEIADEALLESATALVWASLGVQPVGSTGMVNLAYSNPDPNMAALVLNETIERYVAKYVSLVRDAGLDEFLSNRIAHLEERLREAESRLKVFKTDRKIADLDSERELLAKDLQKVSSELRAVEAAMLGTQSRIDMLTANLSEGASTPDAGEGRRPNPDVVEPQVLAELQRELSALELERSKYESATGPAQYLQTKIDNIKGRLRRLRRAVGGAATDSTGNNLRMQLLEARMEAASTKFKRDALEQRVSEVKTRLAQLEDSEPQLKALKSEVELLHGEHRLSVSKLRESELVRAMDTQRLVGVKIVERAQPPRSPKGSRKTLLLLLALALGAIGGTVLAFLIELLQGTLENPEQTEFELGIPVLATMPELRNT